MVISPPVVAIREATAPKIFAAEKTARYRAICVAFGVSPRNTSAAVPAVQSDRRSKRGASNERYDTVGYGGNLLLNLLRRQYARKCTDFAVSAIALNGVR